MKKKYVIKFKTYYNLYHEILGEQIFHASLVNKF